MNHVYAVRLFPTTTRESCPLLSSGGNVSALAQSMCVCSGWVGSLTLAPPCRYSPDPNSLRQDDMGTMVFNPSSPGGGAVGDAADAMGTFCASPTSVKGGVDADQQYKLGVHLLKLAGESGGEDTTTRHHGGAADPGFADDGAHAEHTFSMIDDADGGLVREEDQNSLFGESEDEDSEDEMDEDDQLELMRAIQAAIDTGAGVGGGLGGSIGGSIDLESTSGDVLLDGDGAVVADG
jgi:hypothetical protein